MLVGIGSNHPFNSDLSEDGRTTVMRKCLPDVFFFHYETLIKTSILTCKENDPIKKESIERLSKGIEPFEIIFIAFVMPSL